MKRKQTMKLWMLVAIVLVLLLFPFGVIYSAELAKDQVARLAMDVGDIETVDPHFATKIGEVPIVRMVYESLLRTPPRGN